MVARATVNLQGLAVGEIARVDPSDPYIAELLEASFLVPLEASELDPEEGPHGSVVQESTGAVDDASQEDESGG